MSGLDVFGADLAWEIYKDKNLEKQKMEQDPHYKCKEQMEQYKERITANKMKIKNLNDKIKENETHICKLQELYEKLCNDVVETQKQTEKDYEDWVNVDTQYKQHIKELHNYIEKLKQLNITLRMNQKQINNNNSQLFQYQSLQVEVNALQKQNESIKYALQTVKQNCKQENDNIEQQLIENLKLLNEIQIENNSLEVANVSNDNDSVLNAFTPSYQGLAALFDKNNDVLQPESHETIQMNENKMDALREKIKILKEQLVANNQVKQTKDMDALIAENEQLKKHIETNNDEINTLKLEINALKQQGYNDNEQQRNSNEIISLNKQINERDIRIRELENEFEKQKEENIQKIETLREEIEQFQVLDELQREHIDKYRESTLLQQNNAESVIEQSADEILKLRKLVNELQDELEIEKELHVENQNEINEKKEQIRLLTEEIEQLHVLEEMQQDHINTFRESGVIEAVMSQQEVQNDISNLTETIDLLEEQLSNEKNKNKQYKSEIIDEKKRNNKLKLEIQSIIESKLQSMKSSCKALEQLRNAIRLLQQQNVNKQIKVEKHAWGVLGPLSYHIVDVAAMNN
eukprot:128757_1